MRSIDGRLSKLEDRLGMARNAPRYLVILIDAGKNADPLMTPTSRASMKLGFFLSGFALVDLHKPDREVKCARVVYAREITVELHDY